MSSLLLPGDPSPVTVLRENGQSPFLLACDHAGNRLPSSLGSLGLPDYELQRHIAWDIGVAGIARFMSEELDAFTILQTYSRLVIDCNRPLHSPVSIAPFSENTKIPSNKSLTEAERQTRVQEIFVPYHTRLITELDRRMVEHIPTVLIALHSFTPVYKGVSRPWYIGILYHRDNRVAKPMLERLRQEGDLVVGDNEPYAVGDESDYTVPVHGEGRGLLHVEIEIRQDFIADEAGQRLWSDRLCRTLKPVWQVISRSRPDH
jgi:predicted N-formylglutamate amidohydrolase